MYSIRLAFFDFHVIVYIYIFTHTHTNTHVHLHVGGSYKDQFVDRLMKTYTSEAVFLLTTLVNMA